MKTMIAAVLGVLLLHVNAFSFNRHAKPAEATVARDVAMDGKFQKVSVGDNIHLVLLPGEQKNSVTIEGAETLVGQVNVTFSKNEMRIAGKKNMKHGRIVVYVPAKDINYIRLNSGASLSAQGVLNSSDLTVILNVGSSVNLVSYRDINIKGTDDCDVQYQKLEKMNVITMAK